ncbi:MAG: prepilin-type N-terminal cleavage/methylation domain-containing protein [Candidatus Omnitrophica bacterium]|nr:prepilin-type N-terminal cleavage/methylation domain-containing protein [Candidatus Omnitrophota bacterium]
MFKNKGFTLIELLIVIAIIGILAAAILPRFTSFNIQARTNTTRSNLAALRGALIQYRANEGDWPSNLTALVPVYIEKIPLELLSSATGSSSVTIANTSDAAGMSNTALRNATASGWIYGNYNATGDSTSKGRTILPARTVAADGSTSTNDW